MLYDCTVMKMTLHAHKHAFGTHGVVEGSMLLCMVVNGKPC